MTLNIISSYNRLITVYDLVLHNNLSLASSKSCVKVERRYCNISKQLLFVKLRSNNFISNHCNLSENVLLIFLLSTLFTCPFTLPYLLNFAFRRHINFSLYIYTSSSSSFSFSSHKNYARSRYSSLSVTSNAFLSISASFSIYYLYTSTLIFVSAVTSTFFLRDVVLYIRHLNIL